MNTIHSILCVVDPTSSDQPAMQRAAWLAQALNAEISLLICLYNEYLTGKSLFARPGFKQVRTDSIERDWQLLEKLAEPLRAAGLVVHCKVVWDHPLYEGVVRYAVASGADIVFKDTHHHSVIERTFITNSDWGLIRTCPVPLWLVKQPGIAGTPIFMAAIDPTHERDKPAALDDEILAISFDLGESTGANVHVFHSYDPQILCVSNTDGIYIPTYLPYDEIEQSMRELHQRRFEQVLQFYDIAHDRRHLIRGATHEVLPAMATEIGANVVIMGAISRSRWKHFVIGATAERTLEFLPCDMLIVKPDWFKTPVKAEVEFEI